MTDPIQYFFRGLERWLPRLLALLPTKFRFRHPIKTLALILLLFVAFLTSGDTSLDDLKSSGEPVT